MSTTNPTSKLNKPAVGPWFAAMLLFAASSLGHAQLSLVGVVDLALRNSTPVRMADADMQKAAAQLVETRFAYVPNVVLGSTVGYSYGFPVGQPSIYSLTSQSLLVSLSQPLYMRAAKNAFEATRKNLEDAREKVILDSAQEYIELDSVTQELATAAQQQKMVERLISIEESRTEAGVDPRSELLQARLTAAQLKLKRIHLESRADGLRQQLSSLTGLPAESIQSVSSSIPAIPEVHGESLHHQAPGLAAARLQTISQQLQAKGDGISSWLPQISYAAQYNRDAKYNNYELYYNHFQQNNFSIGIDIQFPLFDGARRAKAKETAALALRASIEEQQSRNENNEQIQKLNSSLRELSAQAEVASLKQQIASEQLEATMAQLEVGNGTSGAPQLSPKSEQLARIDERQKYADALDTNLDLSKARLGLLRALGLMDVWIRSKPIE